MRIRWEFDSGDVDKVKELVHIQLDDSFVKQRIAKNLATTKSVPSHADVWYWIVGCLLTTQQRSGPTGAVSRFLCVEPFPLTYELLQQYSATEGVEAFVVRTLTDFGGIRWPTKIGREVEANYQGLESGLWDRLEPRLASLCVNATAKEEREVAHFIADEMTGFGSKQSRNLLQCLGLSRFEIPIDSRITKKLNELGFPVTLSANALGDRHYYDFVSSGIQELCQAADVFPCILDAAIFTSYDDGGWSEVEGLY